jgi:hypothetical protein
MSRLPQSRIPCHTGDEQSRGVTMAGKRKRELIEPHPGDKRYVRRDEKGRFTESDDVSRSLSRDVRQRAKTRVKPGQGDKGDQKSRSR